MKERPILMRGPLVCATLEDGKWQTRRVVVPTMTPPRVAPLRMEPWVIDGEQETDDQGLPCWAGFHPDYPGEAKWFSCPHGKPGDRLWVRETWCEVNRIVDPAATLVRYAADATERWMDGIVLPFDFAGQHKTRPAIHMPRWASRLTLEIASVRVERLQDISLADMRAEGVRTDNEGSLLWRESLRETFISLWNDINAKRGYGWEANPWVWAISYRRLPQTEERSAS